MLEIITTDKTKAATIISDILSDAINPPNNDYDNTNILVAKKHMVDDLMAHEHIIIDQYTKDIIAKSIAILKIENNTNYILDHNFILRNNKPIRVEFLSGKPSGDTVFCQVTDIKNGYHFNVEAANTAFVDDITTNTIRDVYLSLFPTAIGIYNTIEEANADIWKGHKRPSTYINGKKVTTTGLAKDFVGCCLDDNRLSILVGQIKSSRKVKIILGFEKIEFYLVEVNTGLGVIPMAVSDEKIPNPEDLTAGKVILARTYIALDFNLCAVMPRPTPA